jgi:hypothetical protein
MLLFRSERHVDRWCRQWNRKRGGVFSVALGWDLAREWYGDRLSPAWQPRSVDQAQALFTRLGLRGPFWQLKG